LGYLVLCLPDHRIWILMHAQVGPWSACCDSGFGHSSRVVACTDADGRVVTAGPNTCSSQQPATSVQCQTDAAKISCRPVSAGSDDADCYGHGLCGTSGCDCKDGWHGQFCEVAAKCKGVMDRCCSSGVLNITGECCPGGSVLDGTGACCVSGQLDVCGVCDGTSWTVDVQVRSVGATPRSEPACCCAKCTI
jgi:hypothetical protein